MCWTPPYTGHETKTNKIKNTPQYVLDTTIYRTRDEDKQNKKHNTICVGHHYTQISTRKNCASRKIMSYLYIVGSQIRLFKNIN